MRTILMNLCKVWALILHNDHGYVTFGEPDGGSSGEPEGGEGEPGGTTVQWPEGFDETLMPHKDSTLKNFINDKGEINHASVLKSYIHAQGIIGKDKITIPDGSFTEDQWTDTFQKLGLPELEKYDVKNNLPEGVEANEELFKSVREVAHKAGILPRQLQPLLDHFNNTVGEQFKAQALQAEQENNTANEALKKEWGTAYEKNLKLADEGLKQFASQEELKAFEEAGYFNNPLMKKLFAKVGDALGEDTFDDRTKNSIILTQDQAREEITSYYKADHPFMNRGHAQHQYYQNRMLQLQEILHGNKPVQPAVVQ